MRRFVLTFASIVTMLAPSSAHAQVENGAARAQALFEQAVAEARAGRYATACPKFAASQTLDPKASTLLNLASCYELNGQTASAWATFKEAEVTARRHERTDWAERAASSVKRLEPLLVRVTVRVPETLRALPVEVRFDGAPFQPSEWNQAVPVDPGKHRIDWSARAHEPATSTIEVAKANVDVTLHDLEPTAAPTSAIALGPSPHAQPGEFWTTGRVVGAAAIGVGVASLAAGSIFGLSARSKYDEAEDLCGVSSGSPRTCLPERSDEALGARDAADARATASTVFFVVGGVLVAGGLTLFALTPPGSERKVALVPWRTGLAAVGSF